MFSENKYFLLIDKKIAAQVKTLAPLVILVVIFRSSQSSICQILQLWFLFYH